MLKKIFLSNLAVLSVASFYTQVVASDDSFDFNDSSSTYSQSPHSENESDSGKIAFTRVKFLSKPQEILKECGRILDTDYSNVNYEDKGRVIELCWKSLFKVKDRYKELNDIENCFYTYQTMTKLLLTFGVFPKSKNNPQKQNDFINGLIRKNHTSKTSDLNMKGSIEKWSHIYKGMLFLKIIDLFQPREERRLGFLEKAYDEFTSAIDLGTTKTSYLLLAELVDDYGFLPAGMETEEASNFVIDCVRRAYKTQGSGVVKPVSNNHKSLDKTGILRLAKPTYLKDLRGQALYEFLQEGGAVNAEPFHIDEEESDIEEQNDENEFSQMNVAEESSSVSVFGGAHYSIGDFYPSDDSFSHNDGGQTTVMDSLDEELADQEKEKIIISSFNLLSEGGRKEVSISAVTRDVQGYGFNRSLVNKILKEKGLVKQKKYASHLSEEKVFSIRRDYKRIQNTIVIPKITHKKQRVDPGLFLLA